MRSICGAMHIKGTTVPHIAASLRIIELRHQMNQALDGKTLIAEVYETVYEWLCKQPKDFLIKIQTLVKHWRTFIEHNLIVSIDQNILLF
jgi:hypothetical protein